MKRSWLLLLIPLLCACGEIATLPEESGYGPKPVLPPPKPTLIPTFNVAPARGWEGHAQPKAAPGFAVGAYARGLEHPRWLTVLPNGDVLVAETRAPPNPGPGFSLRGLLMKWFMRSAGASGPSPNRITLLRDADGDGIAETRKPFLQGLNSPFGMALCGGNLYVANADALLRYPYREGETEIRTAGEKVADLPGGPLNHHWTKNVVASQDCRHLFVAVGSNSNVAENGLEAERERAAILIVGAASGRRQVFAPGLRNPVGMDWNPHDRSLWAVVNERDEIGSDLVPDYLTEVKPGAFYGWPWSYYGSHVDARVEPPRPDLVAKARVPDYALGAHTGSLGLAFYDGRLFPAHYRGGAFVAQHGSWNRNPPSGYRVVFVPFVNGRPQGMPEEVLGGFLRPDGGASGRPVGLALDRAGALLVADDVGNSVWRVTPAP